MNPYIEILEHLSYVLECVIMDYMGEAKYELGNLIKKIESNDLLSLQDLPSAHGDLGKALSLYKQGEDRHGSSILSRTSRILWKAAMDYEKQAGPGPHPGV